MKIIKHQKFNLEFFELENRMRIGLAGFRKGEPGPSMFFPESGDDYILVIYDSGWYKFHIDEFTHEAGIGYISEKLHCSIHESKIIRKFISDLFVRDAAKPLLTGEPYAEYELKNPYLRSY